MFSKIVPQGRLQVDRLSLSSSRQKL
jgi:hypothetical protein